MAKNKTEQTETPKTLVENMTAKQALVFKAMQATVKATETNVIDTKTLTKHLRDLVRETRQPELTSAGARGVIGSLCPNRRSKRAVTEYPLFKTETGQTCFKTEFLEVEPVVRGDTENQSMWSEFRQFFESETDETVTEDTEDTEDTETVSRDFETSTDMESDSLYTTIEDIDFGDDFE